MSTKRSPLMPSVVPLPENGEALTCADPDIEAQPEARAMAADHLGVTVTLDLLPPRERQVLSRKAGLSNGGEPLSSAEIAEELGVALNTVSSTLTRARNRLLAFGNLRQVINGEERPQRR